MVRLDENRKQGTRCCQFLLRNLRLTIVNFSMNISWRILLDNIISFTIGPLSHGSFHVTRLASNSKLVSSLFRGESNYVHFLLVLVAIL